MGLFDFHSLKGRLTLSVLVALIGLIALGAFEIVHLRGQLLRLTVADSRPCRRVHPCVVDALQPREPLAQAALTVEFKTPLFLPARASLWNTREIKASLQHAALFEVRNAKGDKPHLRALLAYQ